MLSLLQLMHEYKLDDLALMLGGVINSCRDLHTSDSLKEPIANDAFCNQLAICLDGLAIMCTNFQADLVIIEQIRDIELDLRDPSADRREAVLHARLKAVIEAVQSNLKSRKFMYVPADQAAYWDNVEMFGTNFILVFPKNAVFEMREAGNCFAAGRWTACVFHCMRVAEYGLRKLARKAKVSLVDKGRKQPIAYADWDKVITGIRGAITEARKLPRGPQKEKQLQFLSRAADSCEYMKDIWRNEVSHTRRRYSKPEALAVINRVHAFMDLLSEADAKREIKKRSKRMRQLQQPVTTGAQGLTLRDLVKASLRKRIEEA